MFDNLKIYLDSKLYQAKEAECPEDLECADQDRWEENQVKLIDDLQAATNVLDGKCEADVEQFKLGINMAKEYYQQMVIEISLGVKEKLAQLEHSFFAKLNNQ